MNEFHSLGEFAEHILHTMVKEVERQSHALEKAAVLIEKEAKSLIGEYQSEAGPFMAWAPLADSTLEEKARLGYTGQVSQDDPLLRTGEMRDSIKHKVIGTSEAHVGSDSDIAVFQELGTDKIPPRSFLGTAAVHKEKEVAEIIGESVVMALIGKGVHGGAIDI